MSMSLATGVNNFLEQVDAPMAAFFSSCVNCGLCAEACLFYTETGDPKYTPIHKLAPFKRLWQQNYTFLGRLAKITGLSRKVTDAELEEWSKVLYDGCTLCGRCTMVCPVGNDIAYMIRKAREGMVASGHAPEDLVSAAQLAVEPGWERAVDRVLGTRASALCVDSLDGLPDPDGWEPERTIEYYHKPPSDRGD